MSEKKETQQAVKRSWFQNLKAEFGKITWPTKKRLFRETVAVVFSAVLIGAVIFLVDWAVKYGLHFIW